MDTKRVSRDPRQDAVEAIDAELRERYGASYITCGYGMDDEGYPTLVLYFKTKPRGATTVDLRGYFKSVDVQVIGRVQPL